mgnify:CR=1 FL=1
MARKLISVILPIYNEEGSIREIYQRVKAALGRLLHDHEIIFVDDGSCDLSWKIIAELAAKDNSVRALGLSRNFGQQIALTAGLDAAEGDAVIMMDADLQHPPEMILKFIEKWEEGYDIVYAVRQNASNRGLLHKFTSDLFYSVFNKLSDVRITPGVVNFRLMARPVADSVLACRERVRHLVGLVSWTGFRSTGIPYTAAERRHGVTKHSFLVRWHLAMASLTSFSSAPLYLSTIAGSIVSGIAFIYILYALYMKFFTNEPVSGWASILISVLFLGGIQLLSIGILGEYLGRVYEEVKQRPLYLVKQTLNAAKKTGDHNA